MYTTVVKINTTVFTEDDGWVDRFSLVQFRYHFFLVIEFKVEIRRVELVQTNVAVFAATGVRLAVRMESQRVDGAEMALDATEFLFEYQMEEASVEFADTRRSCGYVHGILATSKDHLNMEERERAIEPNKLDKGE